MSVVDLLKEYFDKKVTATEIVRRLTNIVNPDMAVDILALINQICRHEQGDLDTETFKSVYGIE